MSFQLHQILGFASWFLAIFQLVYGLYIIFLNPTSYANRWIGGFSSLFAVSSFSLGVMLVTVGDSLAEPILWAQAAITPVLGYLLLNSAVILVGPPWFEKYAKVWNAAILGIVVLLPLLTIVDIVFGTRFWYTGLTGYVYEGGYIDISLYTNGSLASLIKAIYLYLPTGLFCIGLPLLGWCKDRRDLFRQYWLWAFLLVQLATLVFYVAFPSFFQSGIALFVLNFLSTIIYGYVVFRRVILGRVVQRGRLRTRLTILILIIAVPILVSGVMLVGYQAVGIVEQSETMRLAAVNDTLSTSAIVWLNLHVDALRELVQQPVIVTMDPEQQVPILTTMDAAYSGVYLFSTTDLEGMNVARSDGEPLKNYADRQWFREARSGRSPAFEIVIGRTSGVPALVVAMPIKDASQNIVGVAMFASTLSNLADQVQATEIGAGSAYIVDQTDQLLAHSDPAMMTQMADFSSYPPVLQLRDGTRGLVKFDDVSGQRWWAYLNEVEPGLGVIVQQSEDEVLSGIRRFQWVYWVVTLMGTLLLAASGFVTMWQASRPILSLTETATAIVEGDLGRVAPVESEDEIGTLARTFNMMTAQLRTSIETLEERVTERTRALEKRAEYLGVTARVSRVAASILDVDTLLNRVARLISERFGFYHTGIFLVDASGEWAVLRAVSSEGGKHMLARGHRLRVGEQGIVGYVSGTGRPRIALDVDEDIVWVKNPDLPDTRSEMALPLQAQNQIIGVLDVQSVEPNAFSTEDVETLLILADQVAIAIQNARQFQQSQQMLQALQRAYGELGQHSWSSWMASQVGYRYTPAGVTPISESELPVGLSTTTRVTESNTLSVPLQLIGGHTFGVLRLQRDTMYPWNEQEVQFVQQAAQAVAQALEVTRLLDEARHRTARDQLVGEIANQLHTTLDPDMIMKTLVRELGRVLGARLASVEVASGGASGSVSGGAT